MYRKRSHGHRYYTSLILHESSLNDFYQLYISRWVCMTFAGNNFSVSSRFIYNSAGQVITGELNIINNYRYC